MEVIKEFKEFALKGNVVDMAVGIIIGASFGKIVSSLVADILMPPLGFIMGGVNFSYLKITLKEAAGSTPPVTVNVGAFFQAVIDFTIIAFALFMLIKGINSLKRRYELAPPVSPAEKAEVLLLRDIRDLLKDKR